MLDITTLQNQSCQPIATNSKAMLIPTIESYLSVLPGWQAGFDYNTIERSITFKNHYQVMAFLNALAFISHEQDHHGEICYGYNKVNIKLTTHTMKGVSLNDMIMAAKINQLRPA
ncbi:MAG: 4a-hydroxytetrahydrobiopterin dehydratase [Gammaproteobacteria bacterium]|nr:4a-hydroxytetrahydrobiopterin dehydratase [Gammaproteobacteria bacterium]